MLPSRGVALAVRPEMLDVALAQRRHRQHDQHVGGAELVIDRQFGTTDVLMILPVAAINARYIEHFGADATRHAA